MKKSEKNRKKNALPHIKKMCDNKQTAILYTKDDKFGRFAKFIIQNVIDKKIKISDKTGETGETDGSPGFPNSKKFIWKNPVLQNTTTISTGKSNSIGITGGGCTISNNGTISNNIAQP